MNFRRYFKADLQDKIKINYSKYIIDSPNFNFAVGGHDEKLISHAQVEILKQAGLKPNDSILEIGSGTGRILIKLKDYLLATSTYVGIDVVDKCVSLTNERILQLNLPPDRFVAKIMDNHLDFPKQKFSFVFAFSVFTHMEMEDVFTTLIKLREVTSSECKLLFTFLPLEHKFGEALFEQESKISLAERHARVRNVAITYLDAELLAKRAGYRVVDSSWLELDSPFEGNTLKTNQSWLVLQPLS
jgi:cyclopropane fatty-acyl-phospholipid synthase-like methyltransferase